MLNICSTLRRRFTLALLVLPMLFCGCDRSSESEPETRSAQTTDIDAATGSETSAAVTPVVQTIEVTIEFNGRATDKSVTMPFVEDCTVFSALDQARNTGEFKFRSNGNGETAFVVSIDDIENERAAGDNWTYLVNDKLGDRSCGVYKLVPGDRVVWHFGKYEIE